MTAVIALPTWAERRAVLQSECVAGLVANHEAAHAVVHLIQGERVFGLTIDPREIEQWNRVFGDAGNAIGYTHMNFRDKYRTIVSTYAPHVWEIQEDLFRFRRKRKSSQDHRMIRAYAARLATETLPDYKPGDPEWNQRFFRILTSARRRARNLLREPIVTVMVRFIAMKIEEQGTLSEQQLISLLSSLSEVRLRKHQEQGGNPA